MENGISDAVELAGVSFTSHKEFTRFFSPILQRWEGKGIITGHDAELVAALFDAHPERLSKVGGRSIVGFISDRKDEPFHTNPTFRVMLDNDLTVQFGISTVRKRFWPENSSGPRT